MTATNIINFPTAENKPATFEVGKGYDCRSVCDYDSIFVFQCIKRSKSTVTVKFHNETHTRRIKRDDDGNEWIFPLGSYSMAPILRADND